jgi:hypothetical protein
LFKVHKNHYLKMTEFEKFILSKIPESARDGSFIKAYGDFISEPSRESALPLLPFANIDVSIDVYFPVSKKRISDKQPAAARKKRRTTKPSQKLYLIQRLDRLGWDAAIVASNTDDAELLKTWRLIAKCTCGGKRIYGYKLGLAIFCAKCRPEDVIQTIHREFCIVPGCITIATFGATTPTHCRQHKEHDVGRVYGKECEHPDCKSPPAFGFTGQKARFCGKHRLQDMVYLYAKLCEHPGCDVSPSYGLEDGPARFCAAHKTKDMVNVYSKKCEAPGCTTQPCFGFEGGRPQLCVVHKLEGMVNVVSKKCEALGCSTRPNFGYEGEHCRFCASHKLEGMINIVTASCESPGCGIQPCFAYKGDLPKRCFGHKLDGMINVR